MKTKHAKAKLIKPLVGFRGNAQLYSVDPPFKYEIFNSDIDEFQHLEAKYVVVSAVKVPLSGPETYIFPANRAGEVLSWGELDGSFRGGLDHEKALTNAGYSISKTKKEKS